jgi:hypothetical protein
MHIPILNIVLPANVISVFSIMIPLVMYDVLEPLGILEYFYPDSVDDSKKYMVDYS